jgi:hypothetical protein
MLNRIIQWSLNNRLLVMVAPSALAHPLIGRLSFTTPDITVLQQIAEDGCIREVTVYSAGYAAGHLKHARMVQLGLSHGEQSIIETNLEDLASA